MPAPLPKIFERLARDGWEFTPTRTVPAGYSSPMPVFLCRVRRYITAAVALYVLPLVMPRPQEPDDIALPPLGPPSPTNGEPMPVGFTDAVSCLDVVSGYLVHSGRYSEPQAAAARVLRAALVDAATPPALVQEEVLR